MPLADPLLQSGDSRPITWAPLASSCLAVNFIFARDQPDLRPERLQLHVTKQSAEQFLRMPDDHEATAPPVVLHLATAGS
jgi:hypothetical protein